MPILTYAYLVLLGAGCGGAETTPQPNAATTSTPQEKPVPPSADALSLAEVAGSFETPMLNVRHWLDITADGGFTWTMKGDLLIGDEGPPSARGTVRRPARNRLELTVTDPSKLVTPPTAFELVDIDGRWVLLEVEPEYKCDLIQVVEGDDVFRYGSDLRALVAGAQALEWIGEAARRDFRENDRQQLTKKLDQVVQDEVLVGSTRGMVVQHLGEPRPLAGVELGEGQAAWQIGIIPSDMLGGSPIIVFSFGLFDRTTRVNWYASQ